MQPLRSQRAFLLLAALLFIICVVVTARWCQSMASMGAMNMLWMRMPGQSWTGVAARFVGMWSVMMAAMMLPSLVPVLCRYRLAVALHPHVSRMNAMSRMNALTALVATGYFSVWTLSGALAFPLGAALAAVEITTPMLARIVPVAAGFVMVLAGVLQLTTWKSQQLKCCRQLARRDRVFPPTAGSAWRHGLRLGSHCNACCAPLTAILFAAGVMDLRVMAVVAAAINLERLSAAGRRAARLIGLIAIVTGLAAVGFTAADCLYCLGGYSR